jgi:hypothetical protein
MLYYIYLDFAGHTPLQYSPRQFDVFMSDWGVNPNSKTIQLGLQTDADTNPMLKIDAVRLKKLNPCAVLPENLCA